MIMRMREGKREEEKKKGGEWFTYSRGFIDQKNISKARDLNTFDITGYHHAFFRPFF